MAEMDTSFYPRPQSLSDLMNTVTGVQQFMGRRAAGDIFKQNIDPNTGQLDFQGAMRAIRSNPSIGITAPEAIEAAQGQQARQQIMTKQASDVAQQYLSAALANPTTENITRAFIAASKATGGMMSPSQIERQFFPYGIPGGFKERQLALTNIAQMGVSPTTLTGAETGTPTATGRQTQQTGAVGPYRRQGYEPGEQQPPQQPPLSGAYPAGAAPPTGRFTPPPSAAAGGGRGGQVTGMPTAFEKTAGPIAEQETALHTNAAASVDTGAVLSNLNDISDTALSSPTADTEIKLGQLWQRVFPGKDMPWSSPDEIAKSEEFRKFTEQIAGAQASSMHATDAYLRNAYGANPSLTLSKLGRKGLIHVLQGNNDIPPVIQNEWMDYKNGLVDGNVHDVGEYRDWLYKFQQGVDPVTGRKDPAKRFDPRVFQYMRMTPDERAKFRAGMGKEGLRGGLFENKLSYAAQRGWIELPEGVPR
jgi:hypothetical protein